VRTTNSFRAKSYLFQWLKFACITLCYIVTPVIVKTHKAYNIKPYTQINRLSFIFINHLFPLSK